jgi:hypothetical protein
VAYQMLMQSTLIQPPLQFDGDCSNCCVTVVDGVVDGFEYQNHTWTSILDCSNCCALAVASDACAVVLIGARCIEHLTLDSAILVDRTCFGV